MKTEAEYFELHGPFASLQLRELRIEQNGRNQWKLP
jgi:hypothetical protein